MATLDEPGAGKPRGHLRKPPRAMMKLVNPVLGAMLCSPFHGKVSGMLALLTFTGRKTGKRYTTPVGYQSDGDVLTVFTQSAWWRNFVGGAPVEVRVAGRVRSGRAETIRDESTILPLVEIFLRENGVKKAPRIGLYLDPNHVPSTAELNNAIQEQGLVLVRIALQAER